MARGRARRGALAGVSSRVCSSLRTEHLVELGVKDYGLEDCWTDYRRYSMLGVMIFVLASAMIERDARGIEVLATTAQRHLTLALDMEARELFGERGMFPAPDLSRRLRTAPMEHRMQWTQSELIDQIADGTKTATVRRIEWSEGLDAYNTPLHVGTVYTVYDREQRPRCRVRLTGIELVRRGALPERLWREDPAASGEVSPAEFRADHDAFFDHPDDGFEFLALYFRRVDG